jgi:hypothetical protein
VRWRLAYTGVLVVGIVLLVGVAVRGVLRERGEQPGRVTVSGCEFVSYGQHGNNYECHGRFVSKDGRLDVPDVGFPNVGRLAAGTHVSAKLSDPDDTTASTTGESRARVIVTGLGSAVLLGGVVALWRPRRPKQRTG